MFDLANAPPITIEVPALMAGVTLISFALTGLFPGWRRFFNASRLIRTSAYTLILMGAAVTIERWHPDPLAVLEIAGLLGGLGMLGIVITLLIPSLRRRTSQGL